MHKFLCFIAVILFGCSTWAQVSLDVRAGELGAVIDNPAEITELTVSGTVNALDLQFMAQKMPQLSVLDLSSTRIVEYNGARVCGAGVHEADVVPANIFAGCALVSVSLPEAAISAGAFALCAELKEIKINTDSVAFAAFAGCAKLKSITFLKENTTVGDNAFADCVALSEVVNSQHVAHIGASAFKGCTALKGFAFGTEITEIGPEAFACSGLESVDFSGAVNLESVGDWALQGCTALTSVKLGAVPEVGKGLVFGCSSLKSYQFSATAEEIADYALAKSPVQISELELPQQTLKVGRHALSGLSQVTKVTIPEDVQFIGSGAMERMTGLQMINSKATAVPELGEAVWEGVKALEVELTVPEELLAAYRSAAQWQDFNVKSSSQGIEDIFGDDVVNKVRGRIVGEELHVESSNLPITALSVYGTDGRLLANVADNSQILIVDLAGIPNQVLLVGVTLSDGSKADLKIIKN